MRGSVLFGQKKTASKSVARAHLQAVLSAKILLSEEKRYELLQDLAIQLGFPNSLFQDLCLPLIHRVAQACQSLPSSQHRFYTRMGGLLDFAIFRAHAASLVFRQTLISQDTEELSPEQARVAYAIFSAALLRGIGVLCTDYQLSLYDAQGQYLQIWRPLRGSAYPNAEFYQFQFVEQAEHELIPYMTPLLAQQWMPIDGLEWIAEDPALFLSWMKWLQEDYEGAGILEAILERAEGLALQELMKEALKMHVEFLPDQRFPSFVEGPVNSLPLELTGLKFLLWLKESLARGQLILNQTDLMVVEHGLKIDEDIFKSFVQQHSEYKNWRLIQKAVMSLGMHQLDRLEDNTLLLQHPERFFSREIMAKQGQHMQHIRIQSMALLVANNWSKLAQSKNLDLDFIQQKLNTKGQLERVSVLEKTLGFQKNV